VKDGIVEFITQYGQITDSEKINILSSKEPNTMLMKLFRAYRKANIYVIIDEYDHFANEILAFNFNGFKSFVSENGFVQKFYETIKAATADGIVEYFFGTGVTPITLDSMTSGFNIAKNFSSQKSLNEMSGFSHHEVKQLTELVLPKQNSDDILENIKELYNGYLFSRHAIERVYNPDMVLYYLSEYQSNKLPPDEEINSFKNLKAYVLIFVGSEIKVVKEIS